MKTANLTPNVPSETPRQWETVAPLFAYLFRDAEDLQHLITNRPLLAHYTSIGSLELILKSGEFWWSNPLFMNDLEEMRFGMAQARSLILDSKILDQKLENAALVTRAKQVFAHHCDEFALRHSFDTYVFCLSEHDPEDMIGRLSMWRGYGGQGNGAALVFNTRFLEARPGSPMVLVKVRYGLGDDRTSQLQELILKWCDSVRENCLTEDEIHHVAYQLFNIARFFALSTKHIGFKEEQEWTLIYVPDFDKLGLMNDGMHFRVGTGGVEPILRVPIRPLKLALPAEWTVNTILERTILGPAISSMLSQRSVERMLEVLKLHELKAKLCSSTIPPRPA